MRPMRVVLLILGIVVGLIALGMVAGGGVLLWANAQRDADGYFVSGPDRLSSDTYALTSPALELGTHPGDWIPSDIATLRLRSQDASLFIGIAPTSEVNAYLADVAHTEVTEFRTTPFHVSYRQVPGSRQPEPPGRQDFWATTSRDGVLTWDVRSGNWTIVVMNPDASTGVEADLSVGVRSPLLLGIGIALLVVGLLLVAGSVAMIVGATRDRDRGRATLPPGATPARPDAPPTPPPPP
jgi:hypothetical protein